MSNLTLIHGNLATAVMLFNTLLGAWGLVKFFRNSGGVDGQYAGALALSPILGLIQMVTGLILVGMGMGGAARLVHFLYGVLVVINIPAAFAFTRGRDDRPVLLLYAAVLFFTAGCGVRAYISAHG
jgi:hypothetical protein